MKLIITLFIIFWVTVLNAQTVDILRSDITLNIKSENGNNGVAIAYNAKQKLYYVTYGGNADYPLEVFSENGNNLYSAALGYDARGMNYDPKSNSLKGNLYDEGGYFEIRLDKSGIPTGQKSVILPGKHQPTEQSHGFWVPKSKIIYFRDGITLYIYDMTQGKEKKQIALTGISENTLSNCVDYVILYTGKKGFEFVLVNYTKPGVYLFNLKGAFVKSIGFDSFITIESFFNVGYANNRVWIYNKTDRQWKGYPLFK